MGQTTDYYALLGVDETASSEVIKKAFKHLALKYHPDVYKGEDAEEKTREILRAYQTLNDAALRRSYDLSRTGRSTAGSIAKEQSPDITPEAHYDRQRHYAFPPLNDGLPAQVDLGEITYLFSAIEVRKLKEQGMLRGDKTASATEKHYCHRCKHHWQTSSDPEHCPNCHARDWREYLVLRCQHCHAVFESEQIRNEIGSLQYGDQKLRPPYELFPLCPYCGKSEWCPAEEERLWNVRDRAARITKWRKRFGLA